MQATVSTKNIGNPETDKELRAAVERFFEKHPGKWTVSIAGARGDSVWELTVTAPDGSKEWVHRLHGEDSGRRIETILTDLERIVAQLTPSQS